MRVWGERHCRTFHLTAHRSREGHSHKAQCVFLVFLPPSYPLASPSTCGLASQFPASIHFFIESYFNLLMYSFNHLSINFLIAHIANIYWANNCRLALFGSFCMVESLLSVVTPPPTSSSLTECVFSVSITICIVHELSHFIFMQVVWDKQLLLAVFLQVGRSILESLGKLSKATSLVNYRARF